MRNANRELQRLHNDGDCPSKTLFCQTHGIDRRMLYMTKDSIGMTCDNLLKLCGALDCTPNDLLKGLY